MERHSEIFMEEIIMPGIFFKNKMGGAAKKKRMLKGRWEQFKLTQKSECPRYMGELHVNNNCIILSASVYV